MNDIQKMFQAIINGQSAFRQDILSRIDKLDKKLSERIDKVDDKLSGRIDAIGKQLAYLEDDAPKPASV